MRLTCIMFYVLVLGLTTGTLSAQEPAPKKQPEPANEETKKEAEPAPAKPTIKGQQLPFYWAQIGLSDGQRKEIYTVQAKYDTQIAELEAKIKALKLEMAKERFKLLSESQQKKLEEIIRSKLGGG